jgi:hypothetical protein
MRLLANLFEVSPSLQSLRTDGYSHIIIAAGPPVQGNFVVLCVCLLLKDLLQSCSRGGEEESGGHVL